MLDEEDRDAEARAEVRRACSGILTIGGVLGLLRESPAEYFEKQRRSVLESQALDTGTIEKMIKEREAARKAKDFQTADRIRDELKEMNIQLEDRPEGTIWRYAK
jgi:cysteinyl-tRNA synthetase